MAYTDIDKPTDYFETILYTGNGSNGHAISGLDFQPDWVWLKNRDTGNTHEAFDSVRGATKTLYPDRADAEYVNSTGSLTSFNSDGFTVGSGDGANKNTSKIVSWNWKAGTSFTNDASSTSVGSVDSAGSVNTDAGFSIINVVKNNTTAHTVAHGLGAVPQMIIGKNLADSFRWIVYHQAIGNTHALYLNEDFAKTDSVTFWNDTTPTSSVFSLGTDNSWNGTSIFYCFAEKKGYSKFGSYTGNGNADGPFFYTGFKPAFIIQKRSDSAHDWQLHDNKRGQYFPGNVVNNRIEPNASNAEGTGDDIGYDFLSNGFKTRTNNANYNASGSVYIYMAFAENPFVTSTGVPATAR